MAYGRRRVSGAGPTILPPPGTPEEVATKLRAYDGVFDVVVLSVSPAYAVSDERVP